MRPIQFCFSILVAIAAVTCQAQVTPVVAKQRVTQDTLDAQGNVIKHRETLGIYLRNSSGSTVSKQYSPEGKLRTGQLVDYSRHKIYALSYEKLEAVEEANLTDGPHPEYLANTSTALGEETVNSLSCLVHPVFVKLNGTKRQIGRTYDSAQYGLTVKEDELIEPPGGPRTLLIVELSDIQFVAPDPKDFSLEKFSFLEKHCAACTKQGIAGTVETLK